MITEFLATFWAMLCEMAPYLLLGFLFAGMLHAFLPASFYNRHLGRPGFWSVAKAAMFGVPLPLCSCGVIPTAMALRREGASKGATVSFLIATPQTGVDSIAATYSMMGLPFAVVRPVAALITAVFGGIAADRSSDRSLPGGDAAVSSEGGCCDMPQPKASAKRSFWQRCRTMFSYGFGEMLQDLGLWLLLGLVIATVITMAVPDDFFARFSSMPLLGMLLVLVVSVPMYLCATGSIPIAMALVMKGLTPGAALVMLMAGPATNIASILMVSRVLGRRVTAVYVGSIIAGAIAFGLAIDYLLPASWFAIAPVVSGAHAGCTAHAAPETPWVETVSGIVMCVLLAAGLFRRHMGHHSHVHPDSSCLQPIINDTVMKIKVSGMMCNHCRANVEKAVAALSGVESVNVDLQSGIVTVEGDVDRQAVIDAITSLGYSAE
ncbi:MAG: SO_0444 family Cu/Zn efflux transporter [Muribaculaceae bacterium]|nr:SO_0444 family Cu/Zn efflux transporter [Muribaculaceae bacterium]